MKLKMELDRIFWQNLIFWDETSFWKASIKFSVNFTNMFKVSGRSAWHCFLREWRFRDRTTHQLKILTKNLWKILSPWNFEYHITFFYKTVYIVSRVGSPLVSQTIHHAFGVYEFVSFKEFFKCAEIERSKKSHMQKQIVRWM